MPLKDGKTRYRAAIVFNLKTTEQQNNLYNEAIVLRHRYVVRTKNWNSVSQYVKNTASGKA